MYQQIFFPGSVSANTIPVCVSADTIPRENISKHYPWGVHQQKLSLGDNIFVTLLGDSVRMYVRGGINKKKTVFFSEKLRKGGRGVSPNPKFSYQKKLRFFWNFFLKGGGSHLFQKGVIIKNGDIGIFSPKRGLSPNP